MKFRRAKRGPRYSVRDPEKQKKSKRKVLSYEDVPLDDYKNESFEINKTAVKRILVIIGVLLILALSVFAIANRNNLSFEKLVNWFKYNLLGMTETNYPVKISGTTVSQENISCDDGVVYVSDTVVQSLKANGEEIFYKPHSFSSPVLRTDKDKVIVYNLGGNGYMVGDKKEISGVKKSPDGQKILAGDINAKGYYCIVTEADGYLSKATVYNKDNEKIFAYYFSEYYVHSVALNDAGSGLMACGVTADNGSLQGLAYLLDFTKEKPVATYNLGENAVFDSECLSAKTYSVIGTSSAFVVNTDNNNVRQIDYGNMELTAYDMDSDTNTLALSLSRSGDGRLCSIQYIDNSGKVKKAIDTDMTVKSVSIFKDRIAVLDSSKCVLYNKDGKKLGSAGAGSSAKAVRLEDSSHAYVLGINEIRKIMEFK